MDAHTDARTWMVVASVDEYFKPSYEHIPSARFRYFIL